MGNLRSVSKALEAAGADVVVTSERSSIREADALCVPGQGIFDRCMSAVEELELRAFIAEWIDDERPYLGICLGMQILFDFSEESGGVEGLGIISGRVRRLPPSVRVPHIGWNTVAEPNASARQSEYFYFDHSFAADPTAASVVTGWCEHGTRFAASVRAGSATGVQFHPEKSGTAGIALLQRWLTDLGA